MNTDKYKVLLFYNYKKIKNVDEFKSEHLFFCKDNKKTAILWRDLLR